MVAIPIFTYVGKIFFISGVLATTVIQHVAFKNCKAGQAVGNWTFCLLFIFFYFMFSFKTLHLLGPTILGSKTIFFKKKTLHFDYFSLQKYFFFIHLAFCLNQLKSIQVVIK
jgi:hypothetical protein